MKKNIGPAAIYGALGLVVVVIAVMAWNMFGGPPPGPPEDVTKLTREDMMRQREAGPPKDEPPLPTPRDPGASPH